VYLHTGFARSGGCGEIASASFASDEFAAPIFKVNELVRADK
jgi:hypothetical protein